MVAHMPFPKSPACRIFVAATVICLLFPAVSWAESGDGPAQESSSSDNGDESKEEANAQVQLTTEEKEDAQKRFEEARQSLDEQRYDEAAEEFIDVAEEFPTLDLAPLAIHNAASAYERADEYEDAIEQYENLATEYDDHDLAVYALYQIAVRTYELSDYDRAIRYYRRFYDESEDVSSQRLKDMVFDVEERREVALLRTASLKSEQGHHKEAASTAEKFAEKYPDNEFAAQMLWVASLAREEAEQGEKALRILEQFIDDFGDDDQHAQRRFEAHQRMASLHDADGDADRATDEYETIIELYDERWGDDESSGDLAPIAIRDVTAESQFMLAERKLDEWEKPAVQGSEDKIERRKSELVDGMESLFEEYHAVINYGTGDWTVAAMFRIGDIQQRSAARLREAELPFDDESDEYLELRQRLDDTAEALEDDAIEVYERALEQTVMHDISNEWTKRTLEALHEEAPDQYPETLEGLPSATE